MDADRLTPLSIAQMGDEAVLVELLKRALSLHASDMFILPGALEGLGKGVPSLLISLLRYVIIIIPAAFLLSRVLGAAGVWNAFWITEVLTAGAAFVIYRRALKSDRA